MKRKEESSSDSGLKKQRAWKYPLLDEPTRALKNGQEIELLVFTLIEMESESESDEDDSEGDAEGDTESKGDTESEGAAEDDTESKGAAEDDTDSEPKPRWFNCTILQTETGEYFDDKEYTYPVVDARDDTEDIKVSG